eukprot:RCo011193
MAAGPWILYLSASQVGVVVLLMWVLLVIPQFSCGVVTHALWAVLLPHCAVLLCALSGEVRIPWLRRIALAGLAPAVCTAAALALQQWGAVASLAIGLPSALTLLGLAWQGAGGALHLIAQGGSPSAAYARRTNSLHRGAEEPEGVPMSCL